MKKFLTGLWAGLLLAVSYGAIADSIVFAANPNVTGLPYALTLIANGASALVGSNFAATSTSSTTFAATTSMSMISQTSGGTLGNAVLYTGLEAKPGTGNAWSMNPLLTVDSGAGINSHNFQTIEVDFNNNDTVDSAGAMFANGLNITGAGTHIANTALGIYGNKSGGGPNWLYGIQCGPNNSVLIGCIEIEGNSSYGLDFISFTGISDIRMRNAGVIVGRNAANSADLALLSFDASNILQLGAGVSTVHSAAPTIDFSGSNVEAGNALIGGIIIGAAGTCATSNSFQYSGNAKTGVSFPSNNQVALCANGTQAATATSGGMNVLGVLQVNGATIATPIAESRVPFILVSSGTMGNNGALTLTTALDSTYVSCYIFMPAGAISSGSAAGWYYTVMASATVGQVFNNTYTGPGVPTIPGSPTPFATTGPGAYTQSTSTQTTLLFTVPAFAMGSNGRLITTASIATLSSAGNKTIALNYGGSSMWARAVTTSGSGTIATTMTNMGNASSQWISAIYDGTLATTTPTHLAINSAANQTFSLTLQLATATDWALVGPITLVVSP